MASNFTLASGNVGQTGVDDEPLSDRFSEPWEDSDLILLVEDEKFHAHRQILSIHSPVFKAMLNSQFKEGTATEISLPGKKADEVLDFLKLLYLKETKGVTLSKMSHLLKLADEYQAQGVLDLCVKSLQDLPKTEYNAVTILFLATYTTMAREDSRLDDVRKECYNLIEDMGLADIRRESDFKNLDQDTMESVLVKRTERLETFVRQAYPQLIGLVEYCIYLGRESSSLSGRLAPCPEHFPKQSIHDSEGSIKSTTGLPQRIKSCSVCRKMIADLVSSSIQSKTHVYGGEFHFDKKLISIMQDFKSIIDSIPPALAPNPFPFSAPKPSLGFTFSAQVKKK